MRPDPLGQLEADEARWNGPIPKRRNGAQASFHRVYGCLNEAARCAQDAAAHAGAEDYDAAERSRLMAERWTKIAADRLARLAPPPAADTDERTAA